MRQLLGESQQLVKCIAGVLSQSGPPTTIRGPSPANHPPATATAAAYSTKIILPAMQGYNGSVGGTPGSALLPLLSWVTCKPFRLHQTPNAYIPHIWAHGVPCVCLLLQAFSAVGAMQGAWHLATGQTLSLSEQQLVDCSWNYGNNGCQGGEMEPAIQVCMHHVSGCVG
jgi:hypothetical protein